ncbi:[FeFe]-hydrogenase [Monocercomonoides exilis]|uniref:[FeFe]-hydrogenase n=1 Tax=Monocercomonoides exilis TaxID=2049356 RepID=UPI00355962D7|nr:[FeFe]-hydrogenase [Monocercomonoides exilis]|eukprot:MONOS_1240.1-p1 / transcript=MONOS_1240.1 / gene=MONOS_1240 / organism=Monocercomonoides_exilis_PA203 / gene_product=[FeFe]-hydrogenase / transcript_product=[FeFe]-hydrogenase / location=Mono_scaffold00021:81800-83645(+) / protein_length=570 / sequence_SO=supercontig / SO=protein_coding / is_pseudo=false
MIPGVKRGDTIHYRDLITEVAKATYEGNLVERIDLIPIELCCEGRDTNLQPTLEEDRSISRLRLKAILGFDLKEEKGSELDLKALAQQALKRKTKEYIPLVAVAKEACHKCNQSKYYVTNSCEGCIARPCMLNCPTKAISRINGKAVINPEKCIACGKCASLCPYNAIHKKHIPCVEICPVGAVSKDEHGYSKIDFEKCIHCGKCMVNCPFNAILMPSQIVDVVNSIKNGRRVVAMLAPAILGQFGGTVPQLHQALLNCGFHEMVEVAAGADVTSLMEAEEFIAHVGSGKQPLMTTSCCPAFFQCVHKHAPKLAQFVSHTGSPMHYAAELVKKRDPEAVTVFVGPCVAKRAEGLRRANVDFVLTAEELLCIFMAKNIEVAKVAVSEDPRKTREASREGTYYAVTQGVAAAVKDAVPAALSRLAKHGGEHIDPLVGPVSQLESAKLDECSVKEDPNLADESSKAPVTPMPGKGESPEMASSSSTPSDAKPAVDYRPIYIAPLDRKAVNLLKQWGEKPETCPGNLVECMACDGGCVGGPGAVALATLGKGRLTALYKQRIEFKDIEDVMAL